ncbi:hypothetical protein M9Y10_003465 [Tritrichomonas musculus]|uniref:Uncharacterized protein n=1 Tax=Tritrichomonas musculus TaxID=1915356 RepID=A0ABR2JPH4_9EUKA
MQKVENEIHRINQSATIDGEAWSIQTDTDEFLTTQPKMKIIAKLNNSCAGSISVFNDQTRDGIRGSIYDARNPGYLRYPSDQRCLEKVFFFFFFFFDLSGYESKMKKFR